MLPDEVPDGTALVVSTSGSTGTPKRAILSRDNLIASADATHERLGGPGVWLLPMPAQHIAGTQVLVRSIRAGTQPIVLERWSEAEFVAATGGLDGPRRYTAIVPTQLRRLLADDAGRSALLSFDGVLIGGAATDPRLLAEALDAGVRALTTYGMSETAGGCVYDGIPLRDTTIGLDDGQIVLRGPTIAQGYLGDPERTAAAFEDGPPRGFRTGDLGEFGTDGRLRVLGRADDLIITGGLKVAPRVVEEAARTLEGVHEACALGLPDDEWGHAVGLAVVADHPWTTAAARAALRDQLPAYALPRRLLNLAALPLRGPGKPDRRALAAATGWQT
ncbi:AMP-binding protein [Calidifontibacter sp. DB0510]|uniref:AMP-binding protein n=2 Tax=Metallococcus carri TaxID=1656884 RepID=A0A967E9K4_9MICO|nr:AMP-binding protein [Metallococcus carri]NOP36382.1 AMP-binding protein [Calidifontibacter sp. DB2511S]